MQSAKLIGSDCAKEPDSVYDASGAWESSGIINAQATYMHLTE